MALNLEDRGTRANLLGLLANSMLAVAKFVVGYVAASEALTADGFNSAGDIFATVIAFVGYQYARKPADDDHHFGHGNAESVAGLIIGGVLFATGLFITIDGVLWLIRRPAYPPDLLALWVALGTVLVKELLYQYVNRVGRQLNSPSLLASARDHRADVLIALTVVAGIIGAQYEMPSLDPLAAVLVGIYIAWMALAPIFSNVAVLMDKAPRELGEEIRKVVLSDCEVSDVSNIRIHPLGSYFMVDLEIYLDGAMDLLSAHEVAHRVADLVAERVAHVQHVNVHVNPREDRNL
ncbi:MAG: cation diffusion facilitator family transporter [Planctomycetota bacterium]